MSIRARLAPALVILGGLVMAYFTLSLRDHVDTTVCEAFYGQARNALDTTRVDAQIAPRSRGRAEYQGGTLTCGELRRLAEQRRANAAG